MAMADQDWDLSREDMQNTSLKPQDSSDPMYTFVHEHLLSILTPFAQHVKDLENEVRAFRKDFLEHRVEVNQCSASQRVLEATTGTLKSELKEVKAQMSKSHNDVTKMIDVFSQVNSERQEKLRKGLEEDISALRSRVDPTCLWVEDAKKQLKELQEQSQAAASRLAKCEAKDLQLQESCDLNKFCFHGLSDRLETTRATANAASGEVQRLKTVESCHHQDLQEALNRLSRHLDRTDAKVLHNHEDLVRTCENLAAKLEQTGGDVEKVTREIAALDQNMQETLLQYEESAEADANNQKTTTNALERLANHVHRTREELLELTKKSHGELSDSLGALNSTVTSHGSSLEQHGGRLVVLEGSSLHLDEGLRKAHQLCAELNQAVDTVWQKAQNADSEIRSLIVSSDTTGIDLDNMQQALIKVTGGMTVAQRDIQVAQAELFALAQKLAQTDGELLNTVRRLDVVHDYWTGFGRGLQETEHEVFEGKSGMLLKKAEARPRQLPALPSSPRPHSTNAIRICDRGEPMPARPSTSMM
eukprot:s61_g11.t1